MKFSTKISGIIFSITTAIALLSAGCLNAFALGTTPVSANESKVSVWIFAIIIALAAIAGIVYFIIQHKNKK